MADMKKYSELSKEYKDLEKVVKKYNRYSDILSNIKNAKEVLKTEKDEEFREMAARKTVIARMKSKMRKSRSISRICQ